MVGSPGQPGDISHHITTQIPQISQSIWCKLIFSRHNTARSPAQRGTESPPTWQWTPSIISLPIITHCSEGGEKFWVANNNSSISFCKIIWLDSIQYNVWNIFNMVGFNSVQTVKNGRIFQFCFALFCTELNPTILKIFQTVYRIKSNHTENISDNVQN